jgi:hypothetical protein
MWQNWPKHHPSIHHRPFLRISKLDLKALLQIGSVCGHHLCTPIHTRTRAIGNSAERRLFFPNLIVEARKWLSSRQVRRERRRQSSHRSPSLGAGNRSQGVCFYDDSKPTILPFRLSSQQSVNTCLERASSNHDTVAFASNQCAPSRQAWTYWYLEILGFLIGGGDSGIRLWHRRGSCCPKSESDSALWDC